MVRETSGEGKDRPCFRRPKWTKQSPEWQQIDVELPADEPARAIDAFVETLDLSGFSSSDSGRGQKAYRPDLMLKVALYAIYRGRSRPYQENPCKQVKRGKSAPLQIPKSEFRGLPDQQTYECPEGHRLNYLGSVRESRAGGQTVTRLRYRCPARFCRPCPRRPHCTRNPKAGREITRWEHEELIEALKARMQTPEAKTLYRLRSQTVELAFAGVKEHRHLRRFSGRGRASARTQVGLQILAHNGVALIRALISQRGPPEPIITHAISVA